MTPSRRTAVALTTVGLAAITLASCATDASTDDSTSETAAGESADSTEAAGSSEDAASGAGSEYADGTYSASGSYTTPGGQASVDVTLTLDDGVISEVTVENPDTTNANSLRYQQEFIDGIASEVVGVPIDEISVDRVGGSSLTSGGFTAAVETIKAEAGT